MTIQYQCNKGYRMEGSDLMTCKENGWNSPPPKCNIVTCQKPLAVKNGEFIPMKETYKYGETVTYSCEKGFNPYGASQISCTEHEIFEDAPHCLEITCVSPLIKNAIISGSSAAYRYGVSVQVRCNEGYRINGSDDLTCGEHGWKPSIPQCIDHQRWRIPLIIVTVIMLILVVVALLWWLKKRNCKA
ncbi:complement component receptor 1-like protein, partial [Clarias magur]